MDEDDDEFQLHTERWCVGLRCAESVPLDERERALIEGRVAGLTRAMWVSVAIGALGFALPLGLAQLLPRTLGAHWADVAAGLTLLATIIVLPMYFLARARARWLTRRAHIDDLGQGEKLRFEGTYVFGDAIDDEQKALMASGLLVPKPGHPQSLEVLPGSGSVIRRTGTLPPEFIPVRVTEVAAGPAYAMRVPVPREHAYIDGSPEVRFLRRSLNDHERAELAAHIDRLRRPGPTVLLWAVWLTAWVVAANLSPEGVRHYVETRWPLVVLQIVVLAGMVLAYARALRLAAGLAADTRTGWAFTLLNERAPDPDAVWDAAGAGESNTPATSASFANAPDHAADEDSTQDFETDPRRTVEFLPHSRALWNERGRPARWRNLRRAA